MPKKQTEWSRSYNTRAYDRISITVPKGRLADIKAEAARQGMTVNGFVNYLLVANMDIEPSEWATHKKMAPGE